MIIADSSRKRKWGEVQELEVEEEEEEEKLKANEYFSPKKRPGSGKPGSSALDTEPHLEARLPVEWQRRLDIQLNLQSRSEVHFHDVRTNKRTCKDDETTTSRRTVSLNLELNLQPYDDLLPQEGETTPFAEQYPVVAKKAYERLEEEEDEEEDEEMVATVCGRCHMLVMLCVSRPCCPNCKFVHPKPDHTSSPFTLLFKPPKCTQLLC